MSTRVWLLRLHCRGVVQGVGFRPCVHRLAVELGLCGAVDNVAGAVRLELEGERAALERFLERLPAALPAGARLEPLRPEWLPPPLEGAVRSGLAPGVAIGAGAPRPLGCALVAPALCADRAPCAACLAELVDPRGRRHRYPFLSCTACGPRYSIATAEPYARAHTTLARFPLCPACRGEFEDPADRRFHAETIACPACGPRLRLLDGCGRELVAPAFPPADPAVAVEWAAALLAAGAVLALQGVGGFQLLVDAADGAAVARLRRRKGRPGKPFALLVAEPAWVEPWARIEAAEREQLRAPSAPIVLLRRIPEVAAAFPGVAPGSACLGVMLPASPLHHLLVLQFGRPLVATSGNRSGEPLCTDPGEALERLEGIADAFLVHDLPIARPLDDSLLQVIEGRPALLRRARGYAPEPLSLPQGEGGEPSGAASSPVLALGGDLKCAPALAAAGRIWPAPHLGDLAGPRVQERLVKGLAELLEQSGEDLTLAFDGNPGYLSHQLARSLPGTATARRVPVPHHGAHGLAVAAEHGLSLPLPVLAFDGLGHGTGGELWGGEVLLLTAADPPGAAGAGDPGGGAGILRLASLRPWPLPGGARALVEPRRAALGLLAAAGPGALEHPGARRTLEAFAAAERELLLEAIAAGCQAPAASSVGRLFDAVASLLGLCQVMSYEGEGGLRLQGAAARAPEESGGYPLPLVEGAGLPLGRLDWEPLLMALLDDLAAGAPVPRCAARFHRALVAAIVEVGDAAARAAGGRCLALAGGCFQNRLLLEGAIAALRVAGLEPFWSRAVPVNDGGLALGQVWAVRLGGGGGARVSDPAPVEARRWDRPITKQDTPPRGSTPHVPGRSRSHPLDRDPASGGDPTGTL